MKKAEYSILNIPLKLALPSMRSSCTISAKTSLFPSFDSRTRFCSVSFHHYQVQELQLMQRVLSFLSSIFVYFDTLVALVVNKTFKYYITILTYVGKSFKIFQLVI